MVLCNASVVWSSHVGAHGDRLDIITLCVCVCVVCGVCVCVCACTFRQGPSCHGTPMPVFAFLGSQGGCHRRQPIRHGVSQAATLSLCLRSALPVVVVGWSFWLCYRNELPAGYSGAARLLAACGITLAQHKRWTSACVSVTRIGIGGQRAQHSQRGMRTWSRWSPVARARARVGMSVSGVCNCWNRKKTRTRRHGRYT